MIKQILLSFDFENAFILIFLNISNIETKEESDIDKSENFNVGVQIYLISKREYKEFIIIGVNLNTIRNNGEEYLYDENDFYFEPNNIAYNNIIQMNCIYNYYIFYLEFKAIYNFFFKAIFKLIRKIYREEETRHWIFTTRITIYRTFIPLSKHPLIYIKERTILEGCQESFCLEYYLKKAKKQYKVKNKNDETITI